MTAKPSRSDSTAATALRTHRAGALTRDDIGAEVRLGGWVHRSRDLGGIVFIDLRDRAGLVQLSFDPRWTPPEVMARAASLGAETVILVRGTVAERPEPARDAAMRAREGAVHVTGVAVELVEAAEPSAGATGTSRLSRTSVFSSWVWCTTS